MKCFVDLVKCPPNLDSPQKFGPFQILNSIYLVAVTWAKANISSGGICHDCDVLFV